MRLLLGGWLTIKKFQGILPLRFVFPRQSSVNYDSWVSLRCRRIRRRIYNPILQRNLVIRQACTIVDMWAWVSWTSVVTDLSYYMLELCDEWVFLRAIWYVLARTRWLLLSSRVSVTLFEFMSHFPVESSRGDTEYCSWNDYQS